MIGMVCTLMLAACAVPAQPSPSAANPGAETEAPKPMVRKRVVAGIRGEPPTLNEKLARVGAGRVVGVREMEQLLHTGLLVEDERLELQPSLADAVPTIENHQWRVFPDGRMETTWRIRQGAVWHDGVSFTSEDLVFTATVVRDLPEFSDIAFESVDTVEAVDTQTVLVRWKRPFIWANTLFSLTRGIPHPKHLAEKAYREEKASYTQLLLWSEEYVGTGAYKLREFVRGSHLITEANERFVLGRPKIDEIEVRFHPDGNALAAGILAGVVDLTLYGSGTLNLDQALQVRDQRWDGKLIPVLSSSIGVFPQFLNPSPQVITEVPFRRALLHAIDRQPLVDSLQAGLSTIAHTLYIPLHPEFKDIAHRMVKYDFDPRRATQLIEGLGYTRGPDGVMRDGSGQRLNLELRATNSHETNEQSVLIVADDWRKVGVGVDMVVIPPQRNQDREYRQTRTAFELAGQPDDIYRLHSREIPTPETRFVGDNRPRYSNPQLDVLIDRFYMTIPRAERVDVLGQYINHITDQLPVMAFFYTVGPLMVSNRLRNVTSNPTWNPHEWDVAH
jgi:peptide/nickel transport system substrate-binding protein